MTYPPNSGSPYAAAPYAAAPYGPATPPAPKGIKGPLILFLSGVGLCVAAVVVLVAFVVSAVAVVGDIRPIEADGSTTVNLESTVVYGLYGNGNSRCEVTGPNGAEVDVTIPASSITVNDRRLFGQVALDTSGDHIITCETSTTGEDVYFGRLVDAQTIIRSVFGVFAVVGLFVVGVPLTIAGIIWLIVRSSNNAKARRAWAAGPTAGNGRPGAGYGPGYPPVA